MAQHQTLDVAQSMMDKNLRHNDSTVPGYVPWWERCTPEERQWQIARLKRALLFCRGLAADLAPHLREHIESLEWLYRTDLWRM
jgi:hypothetical protein